MRPAKSAAFVVLTVVLAVLVATALAILDGHGPRAVPSPAPGISPAPVQVGGGEGGAAAPADVEPAPRRTTTRYPADLSPGQLRLVFAGAVVWLLVTCAAVAIQAQNRANLSVVARLAQAGRWRGGRR